MQDGDRVYAIKDANATGVRSYGEGTYYEKVPDLEPFAMLGLKNPYIELDQGGWVWGFECWWGRVGDNKHLGLLMQPTTNVTPPMNVQPVESRSQS